MASRAFSSTGCSWSLLGVECGGDLTLGDCSRSFILFLSFEALLLPKNSRIWCVDRGVLASGLLPIWRGELNSF